MENNLALYVIESYEKDYDHYAETEINVDFWTVIICSSLTKCYKFLEKAIDPANNFGFTDDTLIQIKIEYIDKFNSKNPTLEGRTIREWLQDKPILMEPCIFDFDDDDRCMDV